MQPGEIIVSCYRWWSFLRAAAEVDAAKNGQRLLEETYAILGP